MSAAATSIAVYAVYLFGQGAALLAIPNVILPLFGLPEATDVWVRVTGTVVVFFGVFYVVAARYELRPFFITTVFTRLALIVVFIGLASAGLASWNIMLFTPADFLFAAWTALALRADQKTAAVSVG